MNMFASVLSPGFGVFTGVLLSPAVVDVVFSLVNRGTGAITSPVRSVRAVRLTLILLILTAVLGVSVPGWCVAVQALRPGVLRLWRFCVRSLLRCSGLFDPRLLDCVISVHPIFDWYLGCQRRGQC